MADGGTRAGGGIAKRYMCSVCGPARGKVGVPSGHAGHGLHGDGRPRARFRPVWARGARPGGKGRIRAPDTGAEGNEPKTRLRQGIGLRRRPEDHQRVGVTERTIVQMKAVHLDNMAPVALIMCGHTELRHQRALRPLVAIRQRVTSACRR